MTKEINLTLRRNASSIALKVPGVYHENGEQFYAYLLPYKAKKSLAAAIEEAREYYLRTWPTKEELISYLTEVLDVLRVREYIEENQK